MTQSTASKRLHVKGVDNFTLFVHECQQCHTLNVHGFWSQLERKRYNKEKRYVEVHLPCKGCDWVRAKRYKLTTSKGYPRMFSWLKLHSLFLKLLIVIRLDNTVLWNWSFAAMAWLERRLPL